MASIGTDKSGMRRVLFVDQDGSRKTVRCGTRSMKQAEKVKAGVEALQGARITGFLDLDTTKWLQEIDDVLHARLAAVGLCDPRQVATLAGWLKTYLDERKAELKPESLRKLQNTADSLLAYLGPDVDLRKITATQASAWRASIEPDLSTATLKVHSGNAKTIMAAAVKRKLIHENVFLHLRSGATASAYTRYVAPEEIARIIDQCPTAEWKLLFGLARYAGLRVPSESRLLTLGDVDFERGRMLIRSPKTEAHEGHEQRLVPVDRRLMPLLLARESEMKAGEAQLVTIRGGWVLRRARRYAARAGVDLWKRLFQTLRSSCEQELAMSFPQYAVSLWLGHSMAVSDKHYTGSVPDELYERAAQNQAQSMPVAPSNAQHAQGATPQETQETAMCGSDLSGERVSEGIRTPDPEDHNLVL